MSKLQVLTVLSASALLGACVTATPPPLPAGAIGNATDNGDGTYSVIANSTTYSLGAPGVTPDNELRFSGFAPSALARGFSNADVTAIGGMLEDGTTFSGISGAASTTVQTGGAATYTGRWAYTYAPSSGPLPVSGVGGTLTATADFGAGTLIGNPDPLAAFSFTATIDGVTFSGTASCNYPGGGCVYTVPLEGGFYGAANAIGGAFAGTGLAGAFYATEDP